MPRKLTGNSMLYQLDKTLIGALSSLRRFNRNFSVVKNRRVRRRDKEEHEGTVFPWSVGVLCADFLLPLKYSKARTKSMKRHRLVFYSTLFSTLFLVVFLATFGLLTLLSQTRKIDLGVLSQVIVVAAEVVIGVAVTGETLITVSSFLSTYATGTITT